MNKQNTINDLRGMMDLFGCGSLVAMQDRIKAEYGSTLVCHSPNNTTVCTRVTLHKDNSYMPITFPILQSDMINALDAIASI